jgi:GAF domain-containing protein
VPILESLHSFSAQTVLADAAEEIARKLRDATPASLCALFVHDGQTGELVLAHASGADAARVRGMRMRVGERLSGWVAANRRTICNSDPALDLAGTEQPFDAELHSCLSTPLVAGESLVGVLSLYAPDHQAFSETHKRLFEHISKPLAHLVRGAIELEQVQRATGPRLLAGLPDAESAELEFSRERSRCHIAAVSLRLHGADEHESAAGTPGLLLARAAALLRRDLRAADLLYRDGAHGLLAVLPHADADAAGTIADRARNSLLNALQMLDAPASARAFVTVGVAATPGDGDSLSVVVSMARRRAQVRSSALFRLAVPSPDESPDHPHQPKLFDEPPAA